MIHVCGQSTVILQGTKNQWLGSFYNKHVRTKAMQQCHTDSGCNTD